MKTKNSIDYLAYLCTVIRQTCAPEKIILFGSRARGDYKEDSDFDLLVVVKESSLARPKRSREIRKALFSDAKHEKDILVYTVDEINKWKDVFNSFVYNVLSEGKTIYERSKN